MQRLEQDPTFENREQLSARLYDEYENFYARVQAIEPSGQTITSFYLTHKVKDEATNIITVQGFDSLDSAGIKDRMQQQRQLVDTVGETEQLPKPALSILVPLAVANEDPAVMKTLFGQIAKSQQVFNKPVEVIVWANTCQTDQADLQQAQANYQAVQETAMEFASPDLQMSTALQVLPAEVASMSKIRSNYMEAFMVLAQEKGYDIDHPVLWLDADTTFISANCFDSVEARLKQLKDFDLFVHPETMHSAEWAPAVISEADDATKALVFSEVLHRIVGRRELLDYEPYPEESGLAFRLSSYMLIGGVDVADPINESYNMVDMRRDRRRIPMLAQALPGLTDARMSHYESNRQLGLTPRGISANNNVTWIMGAKVITSGRRLHREVQKNGASALRSENRHGVGNGDYELYSDRRPNPALDHRVTVGEVAMASEKDRNKLSSERDAAVLDRLMKRLFDDK